MSIVYGAVILIKNEDSGDAVATKIDVFGSLNSMEFYDRDKHVSCASVEYTRQIEAIQPLDEGPRCPGHLQASISSEIGYMYDCTAYCSNTGKLTLGMPEC